MKKIIICNLLIVASFVSQAQAQTKITSAMFGSYAARQIGPAEMSGRITAIDAINENQRVIYVGTAGGGVWKSTNAGTTFNPIFDKYNQSIGALVIDQKNPETVWVATGESNMRNSVSVGDGIYKTTDGGTNWKLMGLDSTEHISKIVIHPNDNNTIYVSAPGPLWSDSKHRGLYKSTDGGKSWNKILFINEKTGCADIILDPKNPETLYASTWQFRRTPWSFQSGGPGSALYKSTDGGKTWKKIQNGFEVSEYGRICLAISPTETNKMYAIVESKNTYLYASTDGGENWEKKSATMNVTWRPFYFSVIMVDPVDANRIYRPGFNLSISTDGGESWKDASFEGGWVHSDHHAIWINPSNNNHILLGTDGGVYQSLDKGNSWRMFKNLPVSQFYHVQYDLEKPYNVYGGLQDNGSWFAPTASINGIENSDWRNCGGGDGFWVQPDREDNSIVYSEYQGGNISRYNKITNETKNIKPFQGEGEPKLRCNWNTPIVGSKLNKKTIYYGAQFLYKSTNRGDTWKKISPDLTTNDPKKQEQEKSGGLSVDNSGAENHCTIFSICESPLDENMIWVGTDDGNVQLTSDGGTNWTNLSKNIKGLPANTWVSFIEASPFDKNTAFVTFDGHAKGDRKTYIYKTSDKGQTWISLSTPDLKGYAHVIRQDIKNTNLLFAGTEAGLFISFDGGKNWINYKANVPPVAVRDIAIHPETNDLILATHGRGVIIIDDITPLRTIDESLLNKNLDFLPSKTAYIASDNFGGSFPSDGYSANNPSDNLEIVYWMKDRVTKGKVEIEIFDAAGKLLTSIPGTKRKGVNKASWDMRLKAPRVAKGVKADFSGFVGPYAPEGKYKIVVRRSSGGSETDLRIEKEIELDFNPASVVSREDQLLQQKTTMQLFDMHENLAFLDAQLRAAIDTAYEMAGALNNPSYNKQLDVFEKKSQSIIELLAASIEGTAITGEEKIREKISEVYGGVASNLSRPTDSQLDRIKRLQKEIDEARAKADLVWSTEMKKLNDMLSKGQKRNIRIISREDWDKVSKK